MGWEYLRIESKNTCGCKDGQDTREADTEHRSPEKTSSDRPAHSYFTMGEREDFRGVRGGYGTFSWRVEGSEKVYEHGDETEVSLVVFGDVEAETGGEEGPCLKYCWLSVRGCCLMGNGSFVGR
jgi:hypothetical protein